ncbi:thioredoxin family protein [Aquabacterium sp. A7-Y]|uniref:hypothetical protein n=1 Tax=Aquabacterium sp. A7-Y TaxID=1349605 RepID=UPI00223E77D4|nr:hypothetical protein [Aquabacterium sp. A7-Y]MCW7537993.1 thioredoxin family protein [Aquabacterium sp. A7-Y]
MNVWLRNLMAMPAAALLAAGACAAPQSVEAFDAQTWSALQATLDKPAAVVFTTTDCVYCPRVLRNLAREIGQRKLNASLIAVVMDVPPGEVDDRLLRDPHYRPADRLLAFSGQAPALRYKVNPAWRGMTPYVVFLKPGLPPSSVTGQPSARSIEAWANARPKQEP